MLIEWGRAASEDAVSENGEGEAVTYSITELTREFDVSTRTVRFYEDEGLLRPLRRGRTRVFRPADRQLLRYILRGRRLGFSIAEIREILGIYREPPGEAGQLELLAERVREKRTDLEQKLRDVEATLREFDEVEETIARRRAEIGAQ